MHKTDVTGTEIFNKKQSIYFITSFANFATSEKLLSIQKIIETNIF